MGLFQAEGGGGNQKAHSQATSFPLPHRHPLATTALCEESGGYEMWLSRRPLLGQPRGDWARTWDEGASPSLQIAPFGKTHGMSPGLGARVRDRLFGITLGWDLASQACLSVRGCVHWSKGRVSGIHCFEWSVRQLFFLVSRLILKRGGSVLREGFTVWHSASPKLPEHGVILGVSRF